MATKVFQRGNFVIVDKNGKETIIPIDNFEYDFTTPTTVKLKDVQEKNEISEALADLQNEAGTPIGTVSDVNDYFETFVKLSSSAPPVGGATEAKQDTQIDQTALKKVGYVLDLTAYVPPPYTDLVSLKQTIEGDVQVYEIESKSVGNTEELAKLFNDLQTDIYYGALDANRLYFVPVSTDIVDVGQIDFEDTSEGNLIFNAPYTATVDIPTGALHQIVILLQQLVQQGASAYPAFSRQSVPFGTSVSFENFKKLSVIIHAPDGVFNARFGSDAVVTLPYTDTVDGERIKGLDFDFGSSKTARTLTLTNNSPDTNYFISYSIIK